jgi:hypothetical protein
MRCVNLYYAHLVSGANGNLQPSGLVGCGIATALDLARVGFGRALLAGIREFPGDRIHTFLDGWRASLRDELKMNPSGRLHSLHPKLADNIPSDFLDMEVLALYTDPITSEGGHATPIDVACRPPQLDALATFAERNFIWGDISGILKRFGADIYPGLVLRQLLDVALSATHPTQVGDLCKMLGKAVSVRQNKATCFLPEVRVLVTADIALVEEICAGITAAPSSVDPVDEWLENGHCKLRAWLPRAVVEHCAPGVLEQFLASKATKKKQGDLFLMISSCITNLFSLHSTKSFDTCIGQEACTFTIIVTSGWYVLASTSLRSTN